MVYIVENRTMNTYIPPFHHRTTLINKYDSLAKKIKKKPPEYLEAIIPSRPKKGNAHLVYCSISTPG